MRVGLILFVELAGLRLGTIGVRWNWVPSWHRLRQLLDISH